MTIWHSVRPCAKVTNLPFTYMGETTSLSHLGPAQWEHFLVFEMNVSK